MSREHLRQLLEELRSELAGLPEMSEEARRRAEEIQQELESLAISEGSPADSSLLERVRSAAEEFEADHPQVAWAIGRFSEVLAGMGL